jgi:hypothetical protein
MLKFVDFQKKNQMSLNFACTFQRRQEPECCESPLGVVRLSTKGSYDFAGPGLIDGRTKALACKVRKLWSKS